MDYDDALFRAQFPAFADPVKYPQAVIEVYWGIAQTFCTLDGSPYTTINGSSYMFVMNSLTAHIMAMAEAAQKKGGATKTGGGFTLSATVGEVSVSKLAPPVLDGWQYWLAQTPYGQTLWALLSVRSVGGFSAGGLPEREGFRKIGGVFL